MTDFARLIAAFAQHQVDYVLVGGLAVISHGHRRATVDLDICYARSPSNIRRMVASLAPLQPRLRGAPPELVFPWDERLVANGLNFTLVCDAGEVDLLGEVTGLGSYDDIALNADRLQLYGQELLVLNLDQLIRSKAAAGRAKDLLDLEALRKLRAP